MQWSTKSNNLCGQVFVQEKSTYFKQRCKQCVSRHTGHVIVMVLVYWNVFPIYLTVFALDSLPRITLHHQGCQGGFGICYLRFG